MRVVAFLFTAAILIAVAVRMLVPPGPAEFLAAPAIAIPAVPRADFWPQPVTNGVAHAPTATLLARIMQRFDDSAGQDAESRCYFCFCVFVASVPRLRR
jgi:hypothetical protein